MISQNNFIHTKGDKPYTVYPLIFSELSPFVLFVSYKSKTW